MDSVRKFASDRLFNWFALGALPFLLLQRFFPFSWTALLIVALTCFFVLLEWIKVRIRTQSRSDQTPTRRSLSDFADRIIGNSSKRISISEIEIGDRLSFHSGDVIAADGRIVEGVALVDESVVTGESAPVVRETDETRNFVTEGARVLSGAIIIEVTQMPKTGFKSQIRELLRRSFRNASIFENMAFRQSVAISAMVILVFIILGAFGPDSHALNQGAIRASLILLAASCLLTLWFLPPFHRILSIAFLDRLIHRHLIPKNITALEIAGRIETVLLLDEHESQGFDQVSVIDLIPVPDVQLIELARMAQLAALCDEEPTEKAIIKYVKHRFHLPVDSLRGKQIQFISAASEFDVKGVHIFNEDGEDGIRAILLGPLISIRRHVEGLGALIPNTLVALYESLLTNGDQALFVCDGARIAGLIHLSKKLFRPQHNAVIQFEHLGIRLLPIQASSSKIDAVIEARQHASPVAFIGKVDTDISSMQEADLGLSSNFSNDTLNQVSDVVCLNADNAQFKHLFLLGRELLTARAALNKIVFSITLSVWLVLIPFSVLLLLGKQSLGWSFNLLQLTSGSSAIFSCALSVLVAFSVTGLAILGLHDHRGYLFRFGRSYLMSTGAALKIFISTLILIKVFDVILNVLAT